MTVNGRGDGATPPTAPAGAEMLLGRTTLGDLRRRARGRPPLADDVIPADRKLAPVASRRWLRRSVRHPLAVLFLALGAATTASLVFAASRLDDDGSLSSTDWFRLVVVGIVAMAFFAQLLVFLSRLPPLRWIRRTMTRRDDSLTPPPLAHIPSVERVELASQTADGFGRLSSIERARIRNQTKLDDLFWLAINLAILILGALAAYGLGYTAVRDLADNEDRSWAVVRIILFVLTFMGLARLLRTSIDQLRMRRQRRRRRAIRRLLRYLLWWDRPAAVATPSTFTSSTRSYGPVSAAVGGLMPFLLCCGIAVAAAAYSPWGEPLSSPTADAIARPVNSDRAGTSAATPTAVDEAAVSDAAVTTAASPFTTQPGAATTSAPDFATTSTAFAATQTSFSPPGSPTTSSAAPVADTATTQAPTSITTAPEGATTTMQTPTTTPAPTTTTTTQTPTTQAPTTTQTPTTTQAPTTTTTTEPPAPPMVIASLSAAFFCDAGTTRFSVSWSVTGDPRGRVDIYRNGPDGFNQIGTAVQFNASLVNTPPINGSYQYWLIANNSEFADESATRDVGTVNTSCID